MAYFAAGWNGVYAVDVSDPAVPFLAGKFEDWADGLYAAGLEYDNGIAHVGTTEGFGRFVNFAVTDPGNIVELGGVILGAPPLTIRTTPDGIAHIAREQHAIVNTSNPHAHRARRR